MPIDTEHWNQYLAQLIQTKHPLVKNISRVINPKLKAIHDLLNFNEKHYQPITVYQYQQQYQIDRTPIPISDDAQSLGIFDFQTESILGVLNLIENRLIRIIDPD